MQSVMPADLESDRLLDINEFPEERAANSHRIHALF